MKVGRLGPTLVTHLLMDLELSRLEGYGVRNVWHMEVIYDPDWNQPKSNQTNQNQFILLNGREHSQTLQMEVFVHINVILNGCGTVGFTIL